MFLNFTGNWSYLDFIEGECGQSQNCHLSLDSGVIGIEKCVSFIFDFACEQKIFE